jgi:hypothetical protein
MIGCTGGNDRVRNEVIRTDPAPFKGGPSTASTTGNAQIGVTGSAMGFPAEDLERTPNAGGQGQPEHTTATGTTAGPIGSGSGEPLSPAGTPRPEPSAGG